MYLKDYAELSEKELKKEIKFEEQSFVSQIQTCAHNIIEKNAKLIFLAGGSCCGKTTTAGTISKILAKYGKSVFCFSTDDFFKDEDDAPLNDDGTKNYDKFSHTDSDYICEVLKGISENKKVILPTFDFLKGHRGIDTITLDSARTDIIILEGIHALNDKILSAVPADFPIYKVSLSVNANQKIDEENEFYPNELRFFRRLIRDYYHRGADAARSFGLWKHVTIEENEIILPFIKNADFSIASNFGYEVCIEKRDAMEVLRSIEQSSIYLDEAERLCDKLSLIPAFDKSYVPKESVINEFIL